MFFFPPSAYIYCSRHAFYLATMEEIRQRGRIFNRPRRLRGVCATRRGNRINRTLINIGTNVARFVYIVNGLCPITFTSNR